MQPQHLRFANPWLSIAIWVVTVCCSWLNAPSLAQTVSDSPWNQILSAEKRGDFQSANQLRRKWLAKVPKGSPQRRYLEKQLDLYMPLESLAPDDQSRLGEALTTLDRFRRNDMHVVGDDFPQVDAVVAITKKILPESSHPVRVFADTLHAAKLFEMGEREESFKKLKTAIQNCRNAFDGPSVEETIPGMLYTSLNPTHDMVHARNEFLEQSNMIKELIGEKNLWYIKAITGHALMNHAVISSKARTQTLNVKIETLQTGWVDQKQSDEYIVLSNALMTLASEENPKRFSDLGYALKTTLTNQNRTESVLFADMLMGQALAFIHAELVDAARENIDRAIQFFESGSKVYQSRLAQAYRLKGRLELAAKNDQLALTEYQKSYEIFTRGADALSTKLARYSVPVADEFFRSGYVDLAIMIYQRALQFEIINGTDDKLISVIMDRLAIAYSAVYQPVVARESWQGSIDNGVATLNIAVAQGDVDAVARKCDRLNYIVRDFVSLSDEKDPAQCILAFEYASRIKGLFARMLAARDEIAKRADDESRLKFQKEFGEALEKLAGTAFRVQSNIVLENEIGILESKQQDALNKISESLSDKAKNIIGQGSITDGIIKKLPADTAVVEIVRATNVREPDVDDYVAFVISKTEDNEKFAIALVRLESADVIDDIARRWRTLVQSPQDVDPDKIKPLGLDVREAIWKPIEKHLGEAKKVVICGEGELLRFPWAAVPQVKSQFASRSLPVWLLSALLGIAVFTLTMIRISQQSSRNFVFAGLLMMGLLWGGWKYINRPLLRDSFLISDYEITTCIDCYTLVNAVTSDKGTSNSLTIFANNSQASIDEASSIEALVGSELEVSRTEGLSEFLATPLGCLHVAALNGCGEPDLTDAEGDWRNRYLPLLNSYLDSGARISGKEILPMSLGKLDLVVLSTDCDDSQPQATVNRGNADLHQAFLLAEAKTVVGKIWSPSKKSSREFVEQFHQLQANPEMTKAAALRNAQLKMIADGYQPCDWAAWSLNGASD